MIHFEDLPNELLLDLFGYFNLDELYQTFWNLNQRLNGILKSLSNLSVVIDDVSPCQSLEIFSRQIHRLKLTISNCLDFTRFPQLEILEITRTTSCHLEQIRSDILPDLTDLTLSTSFYVSLPNQLLNDIFNNGFSSLRRVHLGRVDLFRSSICFHSPSLQSIHLTFIDPNLLPQILLFCPNLQSFHVTFFGQSQHLLPPSMSDHPLKDLTLLDPYQKLSFEIVTILLLYLPHLHSLVLQCAFRYPLIDFIRFIERSLEELEVFQCDIIEYSHGNRVSLDEIQNRKEYLRSLQCDEDQQGYRRFYTE